MKKDLKRGQSPFKKKRFVLSEHVIPIKKKRIITIIIWHSLEVFDKYFEKTGHHNFIAPCIKLFVFL